MTTPRRRSVAHEELDSRVHAVATAFVNAGLHALDMFDPGTTLSREQLAAREREWVVSMLGRSGSDAVDGDVPAAWWRMWPRDRQMACLEELDQERWFYAGWALVDEPSPLTLWISAGNTVVTMRMTYLRLLYLFKRISTFVPDAYRWFDQGVAQHVSADEYEDYEITSREQRSGVAAELEQVLQALLRGQSPISGQPLASGPHSISILPRLDDDTRFKALAEVVRAVRRHRQDVRRERAREKPRREKARMERVNGAVTALHQEATDDGREPTDEEIQHATMRALMRTRPDDVPGAMDGTWHSLAHDSLERLPLTARQQSVYGRRYACY